CAAGAACSAGAASASGAASCAGASAAVSSAAASGAGAAVGAGTLVQAAITNRSVASTDTNRNAGILVRIDFFSLLTCKSLYVKGCILIDNSSCYLETEIKNP